MSLFQALVLGAIQGATEFLPVSSSGHLVLFPWLVGWPAPDLVFGAIAHWGTAVAVILSFRADLWHIVRAFVEWVAGALRSRGRQATAPSAEARLGLLIVVGSIPAAVLGYALEDFFEQMFARPVPTASFLLVTAVVLGLSERVGRRERTLESLRWVDALSVGLAQAAAILPGVSRSGATMATGLTRGFDRDSSARFSFLLSVPIVLGAGAFKLMGLSVAGDLAQASSSLAVGFFSALIVGYGSIRFLMRQLRRGRLYPYAIYCAIAGVGFLVVAAVRGA